MEQILPAVEGAGKDRPTNGVVDSVGHSLTNRVGQWGSRLDVHAPVCRLDTTRWRECGRPA
jgi:hypothetical protein